MRFNHPFFIVLLSLSFNYANIFDSSTRVISTMEFNITEPSTSSSSVPEFSYSTLDMDDPKTAKLFVKKCYPTSCQYSALNGDTYLVIVASAAMGKEFYTIMMESIKKLADRILLEEKADPQRAERMGLIIASCRGEILMHMPLGISNEQLRNLNYTIDDYHFQYHGACDLTKPVDLIADNLMSHDHDYATPRDQIVEIYSTGVSANSNSWISIVMLQQLGVKVGISEPSDSDELSPNAKYLSPLYHLMSTPNDLNGNNLLKDMCINSCKCDYNLLDDSSSIGGCYRLSLAPSSVRFAKCNEDGSELAPIIFVEDAIQLFDRAGIILNNTYTHEVDRGFLLPFIYNATLQLYIFRENETLDGFPPDMDTTNVNPLVKDGIPQKACLAIRPGRDPRKPQWFSIDCREPYNYFCVKPPVDEFS